MASNRQRSEEEGSINDHGSEQNTSSSSTDELATISELTRGAGEMMLIRALHRFIRPIFVPIFRPLICQLVKDELAKQEVLISMRENREPSSSVLRKLKIQFRSKITQPVLTGTPLLGENRTPIKIALVDALSNQIVSTAPESDAKLEILGFRVGDDEDDGDGNRIYEDIQERILSGRNGKRILQGNTRLQLKEGVGLVNKISFTHNSEHTRNGLYRLVAVVVDATLMNRLKAGWTETFVVKDRRCTYHEKHACPSLSDKVYHLQQISYNGTRYKRLKNAGVYSVQDLLKLLYTDQKRLEDILEVKAASKCWDNIVKNAQASNGMFLYLDPRNEHKTGVVLDVKLHLKAIVVEPHLYIAVNQLSEQQKVETQNLVKFASENFDLLHPFDHETFLEEYRQTVPGFTSLPSAMITDGPPGPSSQVTEGPDDLNNSNCKPFVTTRSERGKEKVPSDYLEDDPFHPPTLKSPSVFNFGSATESGSSSQAVLDTCELRNIFDINAPLLNDSQFVSLLNDVGDILNESLNECQSNPAMVSICAIARARWTKVSKLLRRNSVRERISLSHGIQPLKKQRCC